MSATKLLIFPDAVATMPQVFFPGGIIENIFIFLFYRLSFVNYFLLIIIKKMDCYHLYFRQCIYCACGPLGLTLHTYQVKHFMTQIPALAHPCCMQPSQCLWVCGWIFPEIFSTEQFQFITDYNQTLAYLPWYLTDFSLLFLYVSCPC